MSKGPANRYQSAAEMRTDLVRVLSGQRPSAPDGDDRRGPHRGAGPVTAANRGHVRPGTARRRCARADDDDHDPLDDEEEERRAKRRKAIMITLVVLLCIGVLALAAWITTPDEFGRPAAHRQDQRARTGQGQTQPRGPTGARCRRTLRPREQVACVPSPNRAGSPVHRAGRGHRQGDRTDPPANTQVAKRDGDQLTVGANPSQVAVPDLHWHDARLMRRPRCSKAAGPWLQADASRSRPRTPQAGRQGRRAETRAPRSRPPRAAAGHGQARQGTRRRSTCRTSSASSATNAKATPRRLRLPGGPQGVSTAPSREGEVVGAEPAGRLAREGHTRSRSASRRATRSRCRI